MIKNILFATDLGIYTPFMLHHVNALAGQHNARVVVLHVVEPPGHMAEAVVETYLSAETRRELEDVGIKRIIDSIKRRVVDQLEEEYLDGQEGLSHIRDVLVLSGHPADTILSQANELETDLIILGSHGHRNLAPNLLGSVTSKVLQMSRVPVYMVPLMRSVLPAVSTAAGGA